MTFRNIAIRQGAAKPVAAGANRDNGPSTSGPLGTPRPQPSYARPATAAAQPRPLRVKPSSNLADDGRVRLPLHDLLRAGYEFALQKTRGRAEPDADISARQRVNEAMAEARWDMPFARGNDERDLLATDGESGRRCKAGEQLYAAIQKSGPVFPADESAVAVEQGAGLCRHHADRFTHNYWKYMQPHEEIVRIHNNRESHTWCVVLTLTDEGNTKKGRTGDPWKWGPATETGHSSSQTRTQKPAIEYAYVRAEQKTWLDEESSRRKDIAENRRGQFASNLQELNATGFAYPTIFQPESTVSRDFAKESALALGIDTPADPMAAYVAHSSQGLQGEQVLLAVNAAPDQHFRVESLLGEAQALLCRLGSSAEWASIDAPFVVAYAGRLDVPLGA